MSKQKQFMTFYRKDGRHRLQTHLEKGSCEISLSLISHVFNVEMSNIELYQMIIEGQACIGDRRVSGCLLHDGIEGFKLDQSYGMLCEVIDNGTPSGTQSFFEESAAVAQFDCVALPDRSISLKAMILRLAPSSVIGKQLSEIQEYVYVIEMPLTYDGDVVFEFPAIDVNNSTMFGMQQRYDCHLWTKTSPTSIPSLKGIAKVRLSHCGGEFQCSNPLCAYYLRMAIENKTDWKGRIFFIPNIGELESAHGSLECLHCGEQPCCIGRCSCKIYYIEPEDINFTRLVIHMGHHGHVVANIESREFLEDSRKLVQEKVLEMPNSGAKKIEREIAREIISRSLFSVTKLVGNERNTDDMWKEVLRQLQATTNQRRFRRWIADALAKLDPKRDSLDSIIYLKEHVTYDYFQSMLFPGQSIDGAQPCHVMKMSTEGKGSGVDIVNRMRAVGDLGRAWVHFDHVHRVRGWSTMAAHVYDPRYATIY